MAGFEDREVEMKKIVVGLIMTVCLVIVFSGSTMAASKAIPYPDFSKKMSDCQTALMKLKDVAEGAWNTMSKQHSKMYKFNAKIKAAGQRKATTRSQNKTLVTNFTEAYITPLNAAIKDYKRKCGIAKKAIGKGIGYGD